MPTVLSTLRSVLPGYYWIIDVCDEYPFVREALLREMNWLAWLRQRLYYPLKPSPLPICKDGIAKQVLQYSIAAEQRRTLFAGLAYGRCVRRKILLLLLHERASVRLQWIAAAKIDARLKVQDPLTGRQFQGPLKVREGSLLLRSYLMLFRSDATAQDSAGGSFEPVEPMFRRIVIATLSSICKGATEVTFPMNELAVRPQPGCAHLATRQEKDDTIAQMLAQFPDGLFNGASICWSCAKDFGDERRLAKCSQCKVARYCSTDCQKTMWKNHKTQCEYFKATMPKFLKSIARRTSKGERREYCAEVLRNAMGYGKLECFYELVDSFIPDEIWDYISSY